MQCDVDFRVQVIQVYLIAINKTMITAWHCISTRIAIAGNQLLNEQSDHGAGRGLLVKEVQQTIDVCTFHDLLYYNLFNSS